ncbi:MAG TPA: ABC transporter permease [Candidatus Thermoplasmatota archaeon]|nr:ABC transporter permease [Candidatus Thermoplasmatota archaeon]
MQLLTKSTVLGTTLVALAILNFSVLDQVGVGLVASVNDKFTDLGADWIGLQAVNSTIDPEELAADVASIDGVQQTMTSWASTSIAFGQANADQSEWLVPGPDYDLEAMPYLFVYQEDSDTQAVFYRDTITWVSGEAPEAGEAAVSTTYAEENGLQGGSSLYHAFDVSPFDADGRFNQTFTVSGVYERAYSDPEGNPPEVVILGYDQDLVAQFTSTDRFGMYRHSVLVQGTLSNILSISDHVIDEAEAQGYEVSTDQFRAGGRAIGGRQGFPGGGGFGGQAPPGGRLQAQGPGGLPQGGPGGFPGGAGFTVPDIVVLANGDVLSSALNAADRAGTWFRLLTTSAVAMALLGIGFVTAAMERKVRRDVGIRQAVGFPIRRIWIHWATTATAMGLVGAVIGIGLVYALAASGTSNLLLGLDLTFRSSLGALVTPIASVLAYALATLPTYLRVLRSTPAENLQAFGA